MEDTQFYTGLHSNNHSETKFMSIPPSPTLSSPSHKDCICQELINPDDIRHCSLCQSSIPVIEDLLAEREEYEQEIESLQQQLREEQQKIEAQIESIAVLNSRIGLVTKELDRKTEEFLELQKDMELLNEKYVDEIERVAEIQHSKDMVESELEDLSRRLFEEANGMVAYEKREKYNLEVAQKHLENQLQETKDRLGAEQMQLQELKKRMEDMIESEDDHNKHLPQQPDDILMDCIPKTPDHIKDISQMLSERMNVHVEIDSLILDEFTEFVKLSDSVSLKKIHTLPFMKNCQEEDVEACLRFGPNSRLSARKMNEAIVLNTCFIEEAPHGFAEEQAKRAVADTPLKISAAKTLMWERFSSSNTQTTVFSGCQACGRNDGTALPYRFRISYFDDWACIDRYCRDRLVAVCEFYVLIRNIRQGLYNNRSIYDLYHESMRLRLQMFYARMGALPWTLRTLNKQDIIDSPVVITSESSPLPKTLKTTDDTPRRGSCDDMHTVLNQQRNENNPTFNP